MSMSMRMWLAGSGVRSGLLLSSCVLAALSCLVALSVRCSITLSAWCGLVCPFPLTMTTRTLTRRVAS